ncbi:hypothetical protein RHA1_ro08818 (plasmid) [Rhodococcus jostii RHA1]|uniref:Uncharacterized protein n=1 Tax=Rhodococcus jostii (strain RHA1) TaxID=101510 RepID=Q0RXX4_RHOJR|nr:hypothetical protein RHA1_ro08818 [Rhodococcus jostii RHA1]
MTTTQPPTVTADADGHRTDGRSSAPSTCRPPRSPGSELPDWAIRDRAQTAAPSSASATTARRETCWLKHELTPGAIRCGSQG